MSKRDVDRPAPCAAQRSELTASRRCLVKRFRLARPPNLIGRPPLRSTSRGHLFAPRPASASRPAVDSALPANLYEGFVGSENLPLVASNSINSVT
jgi:hypothetical protein